MPKKNSPGCGCCGTCQQLFLDEFNRSDSTNIGSDYSEDVAGWEIKSNKLYSLTAGAALTTAKDDYPPAFIGYFKFTSGTDPSTTTCVFRYKFGYEDSSNYWYAQFSVTRTTGAFFSSSNCLVSLWRVVSGSATQIGTSFSSFINGTAEVYTVYVCANADLLHWYVLNNILGGDAKYSYPLPAPLPAASKQGFELVSLSGTGQKLNIDRYIVSKHHDGTEEPTTMTDAQDSSGHMGSTLICECPKYCRACADSVFPDQWKITIAGLGMVGPTNFAPCNGTYILPGKGCGSFLDFTTCADGINRINFSLTGESGTFTVTVRLVQTGLSLTRATFTTTYSTPDDCLNFDHTATTSDLGGTGTARVQHV